MRVRRLLVALLAGGVVAFAVFQSSEARVREEESVGVVVTDRDLPARVLLTSGVLRAVSMPRRAVPEGAVESVTDAVDRVLRDPLYRGEVVTEKRLAARGAEFSASILIPPGKPYAFNLPVSMFLSAPPRLQLHDRIDIVGYAIGQPLERGGVIVADLEVIDLSPRVSDNVSESAHLTVGATAEDIVRILAAREGYRLAIALRPFVRAPEER